MNNVEIMDLTLVCQSFPSISKPQIQRDNILETIEAIFDGETEMVSVEGEEGIGKTTLLAQFAKRHPEKAISIFIRPTSRWSYDPDILRQDLFNQVHWILTDKELNAETDIDDSIWRTKIIALRKLSKRLNKPFFFVVDGLTDIPDHDSMARESILDLLPLGIPGFRFLFSGDLEKILSIKSVKISSKSFILPKFLFDESVKYFSDFSLSTLQLKEIHQSCGGVPIRLSSTHRILKTGVDIDKLIETIPETLAGFFDIEWKVVDLEDQKLLRALAIVAHDKTRYSISRLAKLTECEPSQLKLTLQSHSFIVIDRTHEEVSFVSEAFRKFVAGKLRNLEKYVQDRIISDLMSDPHSEMALSYLPDYLEQAGKSEDIIQYLSPANIIRMIEVSQSLQPVIRKADLGVNSSLKLRRDGELLRFSIQKAAILQNDQLSVMRSEIETLIAVNNRATAITLAQSAPLKEDRLHLLAVIYRKEKEKGVTPDDEIKEQVAQLYTQIDPRALGDKAVDIASDLIFCAPDLAIELIEQSNSAESEENALDWAFAKLSITAHIASDETGEAKAAHDSDVIEQINSRIKDPKARRFATSIGLLLGDDSAKEVISKAEKLDSATEQLYLLRRWARMNSRRADASEVIEHALKVAIQKTQYAPNAGVFRDLASPLPYILDFETARSFVNKFDGQRAAIEALGPTEEYIRLQLLLAATIINYDENEACNRILEIYYLIYDIDDLSVKTACLARLLASLTKMDATEKIELKEGLHSLVKEDLSCDIDSLLANTADHYSIVRNIIKALSRQHPSRAKALALKLNTEGRRDLALLELMKSHLKSPIEEFDLAIIKSVLENITSKEIKDQAVIRLVDRLDSESAKFDLAPFLWIIEFAENIDDASDRCMAFSDIYSTLKKGSYQPEEPLTTHLKNQMKVSWECIDIGWKRVDAGFNMAAKIAVYSLSDANNFLSLNDKFRKTNSADSSMSLRTYILHLRLAIKAFSGLLPKNACKDEDIEKIATLTSYIASFGERAALWSELAMYAYSSNKIELCSKIVKEYIHPLLQSMPESDRDHKAKVIVTICPALYCDHSATTLDLISKLPAEHRDSAYNRIITFYLTKLPYHEPFENMESHRYTLSYNQLVDICDLIKRTEEDSYIYLYIDIIADVLTYKHNKNVYSQQQRLDIASKIEEIILTKLPNQRFIKHDGYKIAALAHLLRIKNDRNIVEWERLISMARSIPNRSDMAYVLTIIVAVMPEKGSLSRTQITDEIKKTIKSIPALCDKIHRYYALAISARDFDLGLARECLRLALEAALTNSDSESISARNKIIDFAHKIDSGFANSLVSLADADPARDPSRSKLKDFIKVLDLKKKIADDLTHGDIIDNIPEKDLPSVAWKLLRSLNSDRINSCPIERTRRFAQIASRLPVRRSFPVFSWLISNAVKRYSKSDQALVQIRPLFDAILLGAELSHYISNRSSLRIDKIAHYEMSQQRGNELIIQAGKREQAIQFIRDWFDKHVRDFLVICDQYFGPEELEILRFLLSASPTCKVFVLTSKKHHTQNGLWPSPEEHYRNYWHLNICDHEPPQTEIIIAELASSGKSPIHERWWLTESSGLKVGSSFNSLGIQQDSEISLLSLEETLTRLNQCDQYINKVKRESNGERIYYTSFTL